MTIASKRLVPLLAGAFLAASATFAASAADASERVVAAGGVVTEIVYALGAQASLVGVDTTSLYPPDALATLPDVGYVRALSAEGVLSLGPDRIIAVEAAGPPDVVAQIEAAGVRVDRIREDFTPRGVADRVRAIGVLVGREAQAQALAAEVEEGFARLDAMRETLGDVLRERSADPARVLFVLSFQNGRAMVGGRGTAADAAIALAGGVNAAGDVEGFKPMTDEAIAAAAPDLVLAIDRAGHAIDPDVLFSTPSFALTPAAAERRFVSMDGLHLLGFGPRASDALADLMRAIYPDHGLEEARRKAEAGR
ncbi:MAG: ABC transporter substrate-binding protein [Microvirga sp.]|nr:ABC transporter substrate-binding protein [Microvirga sp.]